MQLTHEKAQELVDNQTLFKKVAPGLAEGFQICRVLEFNPTERTYWEPGTVVLETPFEPNELKTRHAIRHVFIYENGNGNGRRRRKKLRRRKKS